MISVPLESDRKAAGQWKKDFKASHLFLFDPKMRISEAYNVQGLPTNVAIGRDGKVLRLIEGADTRALDAAVRQMLKK